MAFQKLIFTDEDSEYRQRMGMHTPFIDGKFANQTSLFAPRAGESASHYGYTQSGPTSLLEAGNVRQRIQNASAATKTLSCAYYDENGQAILDPIVHDGMMFYPDRMGRYRNVQGEVLDLMEQKSKERMNYIEKIMKRVTSGTPESADEAICLILGLQNVNELGENRMPTILGAHPNETYGVQGGTHTAIWHVAPEAKANTELARCLCSNAIPSHMFYAKKKDAATGYRKLVWIIGKLNPLISYYGLSPEGMSVRPNADANTKPITNSMTAGKIMPVDSGPTVTAPAAAEDD